MSTELRDFAVFEVYDRFLSAGFLNLIQSCLAGAVVLQTASQLNELKENANSDTLLEFVRQESITTDPAAYVNQLNEQLRLLDIRLFVMIAIVSLDLFFLTFIQMVQFIITQKKMRCREAPCMKSRPRFVVEMTGDKADELLSQAPRIQLHNVCIKYIFVMEFALWIGALSLAIEFKNPSDDLYGQITQLKVAEMDENMFDLYLSMRDTAYGSKKMFFEVALIYGLMLGSLALFTAWEVLDAVLKGSLTKCIVSTCCICCCVQETSEDVENDFLDQLHALESLGNKFDKKIAS